MTTESASPRRDVAKTTTNHHLPVPPPPPSSWPLWRFLPVPRFRFRFMVHDKWSNVLFLHWRVPNHLEPILEKHTAPFCLDRFDGSAWIGLILLTEEAVGPSLGRTRYTCVTHHGVNVRTYVRGSGDATATVTATTTATTTTTTAPRGIHFSSLECDDEFTSYGANFFGMPYRVATMERTYGRSEPDSASASAPSAPSSGQASAPAPAPAERYWYRLRSERLPQSTPSLLRVLSHALRWWRPRKLHTTTIVGNKNSNNNNINNNDHENKAAASNARSEPSSTHDSGESSSRSNNNNNNKNNDALPQSPKAPQTFTVDCSWSRSVSGDASDATAATTTTATANPAKDPFVEWACERYFVYTEQYGIQWRGAVEHEPWPNCPVRLEHLSLTGVGVDVDVDVDVDDCCGYEPKELRPLLSHMARTPPDRVGFSPGVGPVRFQMLQPVGAG